MGEMGAGWYRTGVAAAGPVPVRPEPNALPPVQSRLASISAEQFALNLVERAVTIERVAAVITAIAGDRITVGPLFFGPGNAASATGVGAIGPVRVARLPGHFVTFEATVPGELTIELTVGRRTHSFYGRVEVPLRIEVRLADPVLMVLDVTPVRPTDVAVRLRTSGMATFVLQTLGDADAEIAAQVACVVNDKLRVVQHLGRIDVGTLLDDVWDADLRARLTALDRPS
ncbi:MAG: hypothetical protein M3N98_07640 [Actinomycetota bacterium]|nr:hypothetical protein [Actinomycetota bacterium]